MESVIRRVKKNRPLRVLEAGAGIGTMAERLIDWGLLTHAEYTAVDSNENSIQRAGERLTEFCRDQGFTCQSGNGDDYQISGEELSIQLRFRQNDIFEFLRDPHTKDFDLVVAHAFLDIFPIRKILPPLLSAIRPGGVYYFTLNYDGLTRFFPIIDRALDDTILRLYNERMDRKGDRSGSQCGRQLVEYLALNQGTLLAGGSSDWIVHPVNGRYSADTRRFLECILRTAEDALRDTPNVGCEELRTWLTIRAEQLEKGSLIYLSHQIDVTGRQGLKMKDY